MCNTVDLDKILSDTEINKDAKFMLLILGSKIDKEGLITISINSLVKYFDGKRKGTIIQIIKILEDNGYIQVVRNSGHSNSYKILEKCLIKTGDETSTQIDTGNYWGNGTSDTGDTGTVWDTSTSIPNDTTKKRGNVAIGIDISDFELDTSRLNYNNYINNNNIYNKKIYNYIFNLWNEKSILHEDSLNTCIISAIDAALKKHSYSSILTAIKNYSKILESQHFYNHRWNLVNFLTRPNGISRFINNGDMWLDYKAKYYTEVDKYLDLGIKLENYID